MNEVVKVAIPVTPATAVVLRDPQRAAAIGRMVDRIVTQTEGGDDLIAAFNETRAAAGGAGGTVRRLGRGDGIADMHF